ncbi:GNAT family N-acetyltransferase [Kineococcus sp. T13]|nr:GNAT family N-acetyltransferase [Kineococcus vitellinus]
MPAPQGPREPTGPVRGPVDGPAHDARTARLSLRAPTPDDVPELFALYSDPRVWRGDPLLRHPSPARTRELLERWRESWRSAGLGLWVARALPAPGADEVAGTGELVGVGGCSLRAAGAWNLAFTLHPERWGRGYAQEVAAAGTHRARRARPELPVTAVVAGRNERSVRAVRRAGLHEVWRGPDARDPDPAATLLLFADRPLPRERVRALVA